MERSDLKNIVIHCTTQTEADECCELAGRLGWRWVSGQSYVDTDNCWHENKDNTVYDFYNNDYCNILYAITNGYKIKSAQWFLDNFTPKEKNGDDKKSSDIDWEQRRFETAKSILASMFGYCVYDDTPIEKMVETSKLAADTLIKGLKGEK